MNVRELTLNDNTLDSMGFRDIKLLLRYHNSDMELRCRHCE